MRFDNFDDPDGFVDGEETENSAAESSDDDFAELNGEVEADLEDFFKKFEEKLAGLRESTPVEEVPDVKTVFAPVSEEEKGEIEGTSL